MARTPVRALSTAPRLAAESVKPPVTVHGVEGRYSTALYSVAAGAGTLEKVEKELASISKMIAADPAMAAFLASPVLSRAEKAGEINRVLTSKKFSDTVVNLFTAMGENNRLQDTAAVIAGFETLMSAHRNELMCKVTSAKPLDKATMSSLSKSHPMKKTRIGYWGNEKVCQIAVHFTWSVA